MKKIILSLAFLSPLLFCTGCNKSWHEKYSLRAEDYFTDEKVIKLCKAIELKKVDDVKALIAQGADVNSKGKKNMTPLLWAYPTGSQEIFRILLENKADPNVIAESDFGAPYSYTEGAAVTHLVCRSGNPYFDDVFKFKGNPDLPDTNSPDFATPLFYAIEGRVDDQKQRISALIKAGANIDYSKSRTPLVQAANFCGQYDICNYLLDLGANPFIQNKNGLYLMHHLVSQKANDVISDSQLSTINLLIKRLVDSGDNEKTAVNELEALRAINDRTKPESIAKEKQIIDDIRTRIQKLKFNK